MSPNSSLLPPNETENTATSASTITTLHPDIIHAQILSRLHVNAIVAAASASSHLRRLCAADHLWREICTATWPSLNHPAARSAISAFPSGGYHTLFSDAFPSLNQIHPDHRPPPSPPTKELISAVDIHYNGKPVFSRDVRTETTKNWFLSSPFWIDAVEPDEVVPTPVKFSRPNEEWLKHLEESLSLSWILIDTTKKRAVNLSSRLPVSAGRHWLTRELEVVYAVTMMDELVRCVAKVTCCGKVGGEVHVREVRLAMEDADGGHVRGEEGVGIVGRAMECGERKRVVDEKERYQRFEGLKRERREAKHRLEKAKGVFTSLMAFFAFILLCCLAGL